MHAIVFLVLAKLVISCGEYKAAIIKENALSKIF